MAPLSREDALERARNHYNAGLEQLAEANERAIGTDEHLSRAGAEFAAGQLVLAIWHVQHELTGG